MIKVIFNGTSYDVNEGTTLQSFISDHGAFDQSYTVGGQAVASNFVLQSYSVVENNPAGTLVTAAQAVNIVTINLEDFTGRSGSREIANNIASVRELYQQDVRVTVIRDGQTIDTQILQTGDRVMVSPAGGVKGA